MTELTRNPSLKNKPVDDIIDALKAATEYPVPTKGYDNRFMIVKDNIYMMTLALKSAFIVRLV